VISEHDEEDQGSLKRTKGLAFIFSWIDKPFRLPRRYNVSCLKIGRAHVW
jgi:hypothetical protein